MRPVLFIPGYGNSGPGHWQSLWEPLFPNSRRVPMPNWFAPRLGPWVEALDVAILRCLEEAPPILVAHDLGCIAVAHWSDRYGRSIHGALLVAPTDPERPNAPEHVRAFAPIPPRGLPFPSRVVASGNDPQVSLARAQGLADLWGSTFTDLGPRGHLNGASGHGEWPRGQALLRELF